jgi:hypothetical protein
MHSKKDSAASITASWSSTPMTKHQSRKAPTQRSACTHGSEPEAVRDVVERVGERPEEDRDEGDTMRQTRTRGCHRSALEMLEVSGRQFTSPLATSGRPHPRGASSARSRTGQTGRGTAARCDVRKRRPRPCPPARSAAIAARGRWACAPAPHVSASPA